MDPSQTSKVVVYSTVWCGFCRAAKHYLSSLGVKFEEVDVEKDQTAGMYIYQKTGSMGVPVISVGEEFILGFDRGRLDGALRQHKLIK